MSGGGGARGDARARVYRELMRVGPGEVTTYADLARAAGIPGGQRAVGRMMATNPWPGIVPCHRVVRSDGTLGGYAHGGHIKEAMLESEGVHVRRGKISGFGGVRHSWGRPRRPSTRR
ncbi:MAG: MGMT family protein [Thaumarchaeota archaeon]|nr:MGMT family protein [Nitrososphaerota archaeon]MDD9843345.1 MGMT family protein [Nitrososphaerota archaeon]